MDPIGYIVTIVKELVGTCYFQIIPPSSNLAHFWTPLDGPQGPNAAQGARQESIFVYGRLNSDCPLWSDCYPVRLNKMLWVAGLYFMTHNKLFEKGFN